MTTTSGVLNDGKAERRVEFPTPEGIHLELRLASVGDRLMAFLLDALIVAVTIVGMTFALATAWSALSMAIFWVLFFVARNFYFVWIEWRGRGTSIGKRWRKLVVVDADGGVLDGRSLVVRNLMREVDTFLPLTLIPLLPVIWPDAPGALALVVLLWLVIMALLPVFDGRSRRLGDLVAGTIVLEAPRPMLLPDLAETAAAAPSVAAEPEFSFTAEQLATYGVYELQTLERVLRQAESPAAIEARATVCATIQEKIGWTGPRGSARRFLHAFYAALRADLERRMLLGDRRADKHAAAQSETPTRRPPRDRPGESRP